MLKGRLLFNHFQMVRGGNNWEKYNSKNYSDISMMGVDDLFIALQPGRWIPRYMKNNKKYGESIVILTTNSSIRNAYHANYQYFINLVLFLEWEDPGSITTWILIN